MRRRTLRPNSVRLLKAIIVPLSVVLGLLTWALWELGRLRAGRAFVAALSGAVFLFFAIGWAFDVH